MLDVEMRLRRFKDVCIECIVPSSAGITRCLLRFPLAISFITDFTIITIHFFSASCLAMEARSRLQSITVRNDGASDEVDTITTISFWFDTGLSR